MANVKISGLTAAGAASGTMEFEVNDSLTSKKVTGTQVADFVLGTLNSTDISGAGGLLAANNLSDIVVPATARTNLGLGTAALSAATDFVAVTGDAMTGNLTMADSVKVVMGTGSDMEIYHNGIDSVIHDNGIGDLKIRTSQLSVKNAADTATQITATEGGAVTLYHNNSSKLSTSSTGVTVTGTLAATAVTGDGSGLTNLPSSAPTTAQVLSATAGASAGAVGTYAWLAYNYFAASGGSPNVRNFGSTEAGGNLIASGAVSTQYNSGTLGAPSSISMSVQSGTWMAMGATQSNRNADDGHTIWLRIA